MSESTLLLVQVVFRHGARAPDHRVSYPGDPHKDVSFLPFGKGELTKHGRKQSYEFGKELRDKYGQFLGEEYYEGIIEAHSSEVARARTTLQLVLAGLFPPTPATLVDEALNWQPIIYNYKPLHEDPLMGRMIMQMLNNESHSMFGKSENSLEVIQRIEDHLGWKVEHNSQCILLYDIVKTQRELGLELPAWAEGIFPEKLKQEVDLYVGENFQRDGYIREGTGHLIKKIVDDMFSKEIDKNQGTPKIVLYSGHDINIIALMKLLKFEDVWPQYMASLTFELHQIGDKYFVKVIFVDGYYDMSQKNLRLQNPTNLSISQQEMIELHDFAAYVRDYFPKLE